MARITWQNVAAPDFSSSMQGLRLASGMFTDAMQGLRTGMQDFQRQRQEQADASVLARALGYTDPEAFNRDIASGSLYGDIAPNSLSRDALQLLNNRSGELLINAGRQQTLDQNRYTHDRTVTQNQALDAARGAIGEFLATGSGGGNISDFYRGNADLLSQIDPEQLSNLFNRASGLSSDNLNRRNTQQIMGQRAATHNQTMSNLRSNEAILSQLPAIYSNANDPEAIRDHISSLDAPPRVIAGLMAEANKLVPGLYPGTFTAEADALSRQQAQIDRARNTGRSSGNSNQPPSDLDINLGVVGGTATDATQLASATSNINTANVISRYLESDLDTPFKAGTQVANDTGLPVSEAVKAIEKIVNDEGLSPQAAAGIVATNTVSTAGNRFTVRGSRDPVIGRSLGSMFGINLPSINDVLSATGINSLGDMIVGEGPIVNDSGLSEGVRNFTGTPGNISSFLGDRSASRVMGSLPSLLTNAIRGEIRARTALDNGLLRNVPDAEKNALWEQVERSQISVSELERRINDLATKHAR